MTLQNEEDINKEELRIQKMNDAVVAPIKMQKLNMYGLKAYHFRDAIDRIEKLRIAVSEAAEKRANKYKNII